MPFDKDSIYMGTRYKGVGNVIKFYKKNGVMRWRSEISAMTRLNAVATPRQTKSDYFFACGTNNYDDRGVSPRAQERFDEAWIMRMDE